MNTVEGKAIRLARVFVMISRIKGVVDMEMLVVMIMIQVQVGYRVPGRKRMSAIGLYGLGHVHLGISAGSRTKNGVWVMALCVAEQEQKMAETEFVMRICEEPANGEINVVMSTKAKNGKYADFI